MDDDMERIGLIAFVIAVICAVATSTLGYVKGAPMDQVVGSLAFGGIVGFLLGLALQAAWAVLCYLVSCVYLRDAHLLDYEDRL